MGVTVLKMNNPNPTKQTLCFNLTLLGDEWSSYNNLQSSDPSTIYHNMFFEGIGTGFSFNGDWNTEITTVVMTQWPLAGGIGLPLTAAAHVIHSIGADTVPQLGPQRIGQTGLRDRFWQSRKPSSEMIAFAGSAEN